MVSLGELVREFNARGLLALYALIAKVVEIAQTASGEPGEKVKASLDKPLAELEELCEALGLKVAIQKVGTIRANLKETDLKKSDMASDFKGLEEIIAYEIKSHLFLYIEPGKVRFYSSLHLFGEEVSDQFPSAIFDIEEAGKCLALNRGTACVYHLMRVLEIGLYALGNNLGIEKMGKNWHNAIEQIESVIRDLPKGNERKRAYSEIATHFMHVKEAWRNRTAHIGQVYTDEKAEQIFENVRGFTQILATRLSEKPASQSGPDNNEP